jgi:hypothetical protein
LFFSASTFHASGHGFDDAVVAGPKYLTATKSAPTWLMLVAHFVVYMSQADGVGCLSFWNGGNTSHAALHGSSGRLCIALIATIAWSISVCSHGCMQVARDELWMSHDNTSKATASYQPTAPFENVLNT